jgi:hypothetical protein
MYSYEERMRAIEFYIQYDRHQHRRSVQGGTARTSSRIESRIDHRTR